MNLALALRDRLLGVQTALRVVTLIFASVLSLRGATYFVDYASGSDANVGTSATAAWKHSPGDPAATQIAAAISLLPGDTVLFKGGVSYLLTHPSGIVLRWNGTSGSPITYDGNSSGTWGSGRARFTANYAANITAFTAPSAASSLVFTNLEIAAIGGSASLPADDGAAVAPRFGGGLAFPAGLSHTTIQNCVFSALGYAFGQKPMAATSLSGTAIALPSATNVTIASCDFSRVAIAIDFSGTGVLQQVTVAASSFHDGVLWPFELPTVKSSGVEIYSCTESNNTRFDSGVWTGYGSSPRTTTRTIAAGMPVSFHASAAALPAASYQWRKNGQPISGATTATLGFSTTSTADAATYTVLVTNSLGSSLSPDFILNVTGGTSDGATTIASAPVITTHPVSATAAPLGTVEFRVAATGTPAPTYQWYRNGQTFAGWTGATLTLAGVSSNDVGTYTAVATNSAGSATSNPATLSVGTTTTTPPPAPVAVAPVITTQPVSQTVAPGASATFTVAASGSPTPTFQWFRNNVALAGASSPSLTLTNVSSSDAGTYTAVASNSAGSATSTAATLSLLAVTAPTAIAPTITTQPQSQTAASGSTITLTVAASGTPTPTFQWFRNGITFAGWTGSTLTLPSLTSNDAGTYTAVATNSAGSATSNSAVISIGSSTTPPPASSGVAPVITTQPVSQTVANRSTASLSVAATGTPAPTFQWFRNGVTFAGWTGATLTLRDVTNNDAGTYTVVATNSAGSVTSTAATLTVVPRSKLASAITDPIDSAIAPAGSLSSRLVNLSVRSSAGIGSESLIVGFVVSGGAEKSLLIRGSGPALEAFGVSGVLEDPALSLYSGSTMLAMNDDWSSAPGEAIAPAAASVGAFAFSPRSRDAALLATVDSGAYTGQVSGKDAQPGTALIEVYDAEPETAPRLVNVSVRTTIATNGNAPVIGFVVAGLEPKRLLIRAVGPSLADFGVSGAAANPALELFAGATRIGANDDWAGSDELADTFARAGAFPLPDRASKDAALVVTTAPGDYTVVVSSAERGHGIVLVEVYELP